MCGIMSPDNSIKYPLLIENSKITDNTLEFTILNNTNSTCSVYLNDKLIEKNNEKRISVCRDISKIYISNFHIKVETEDNFIFKTLTRDLSNYFTGLKKTLLGKDNSYFLVNDRNNEIRQHYDSNYDCNLDIDKFKQSTLSKKSYLDQRNINYGLFVVPDKSITLRNKLPFETNSPYRYTDTLKDIVYDLDCIVNPEDRYNNDTHISSKSSLKIVSYMTSIIHNSSYDDIFKSLKDNTHFEHDSHFGDLFNFKNWSYDRDELFHDNKYLDVDVVRLNNQIEKVKISEIPSQFRYISRRESKYFKNEHSISDKRAVILHDSSTLLLMDALIAYYKEVFFYWDHWFFNDELIKWFNPDDVLEIRTERFLDNPQYPIVDERYFVKFPISAELKEIDITKEELNAKVLIKDYRQLPVKTNIKTYIDDKLISEEESSERYYHFKYPLTSYANGEHTLRFEIKSRYKIREVLHEFVLEDSIEPLFNNLKQTFKGIGDTFFLVNDKSNELRQHYDKMFVSNFNRKRFITTLNSKKSYLKKMNVNYDLFIIPDKSVVLSDSIPFKKDEAYRHVNLLKDDLVDLMDILTDDDYLLNDTNVSMCAGLKIVSYILSRLNENKTMDDYQKELLNHLVIENSEHRGNLFTKKSWSYPENIQLRDKYYAIDTKLLSLKDNYIEHTPEDIPLEFRKFSSNLSQYFHNDNSITNKRVLVLCDDSIKPLVTSLLSYYRDVFLYYDLWFFNKGLVEWFNPNDVLEIRSERTLETAQYQLVSIEDNYVIPITRKIEKLNIENGVLTLKILYRDLRHVPVKSTCIIYIDGKKTDEVKINALLDVNYRVTNGKHVVEVILEETTITKRNVFKQKVGE